MNEDSNPQLIYDQTYTSVKALVDSWGEPAYRTDQIWSGLYHQYWSQADQFSTLSKKLRDKLSDQFVFNHLTKGQEINSSDGETTKTYFSLPGSSGIEVVLMRYKNRRTICISTQSGCAMGCVFCATGQMGFTRNLTSGEIIEQVLFYARRLALKGERVTNVVIMGMGEPFHNYDATMEAIDRLGDPQGFKFGARRFTISTVGLVPAIRRFTNEHRQVNLAVSLHAIEDDLRNTLIPINKKYPLAQLFQACNEYVDETNRRITFEWALINGVNDTLEQAYMLAKRLQLFRRSGSILCHVNIIPLNPTTGYAQIGTPRQQALKFKTILESQGIPCTIRIRRGLDIQAGCGQLAIENPARQTTKPPDL